MKSFGSASKLQAFLQHPRCPPLLRQALPIINEVSRMGSSLSDARREGGQRVKSESRPIGKVPGLLDALRNYFIASNSSRPLPHSIHTIREIQVGRYDLASEQVNLSKSRVSFLPQGRSDARFFGVIQVIFKLDEESTTYLAGLQRYLPVDQTVKNPFTGVFEDFGACLVSEAQSETLEIIPVSEDIHPTMSRPFATSALVLRDCARVSVFLCHLLSIAQMRMLARLSPWIFISGVV